MSRYLLSILKGQRRDFVGRVIVGLLLPWSSLYGLGVCLHRLYWQIKGPFKSSKPVLSIGNITVGGSGKTPLVIWLARNLQSRGLHPVILTRGYMPKASGTSDEVDMLNEQIPDIAVLAGADRCASIRRAQETMPVDIFICDDAFQHWPLQRDLNIVAVDAVNPFGNGFMLPAGVLREPLSALQRANVFVLTKTESAGDTGDLKEQLKHINPQALILQSRYQTASVIDVFEGGTLPKAFLDLKSVVGFCAIGEPSSFEWSLKNTGAEIAGFFTYRDHHVYGQEEIKRMLEFCRERGAEVLVTTHKDAVKLRPLKGLFSGFKLVYLPIELEITEGSDEFFHKVISICQR